MRHPRFRTPGSLLLGLVATLLGLMPMGGCATYLQPFEVERATPLPPTPAESALHDLPPPAEPVVVAVYRFRDQTGQYKALENMSTFSTAVTQGATSILTRALEESGWFVPIEREGLSNLLNERQIIQSIRAQHAGPEGQGLGPLPPLLYAGVLLEGGIVGYDTNVLTSGAGVRYFGAGGSGQVRQDQVTVYLRAVSTQSGRVLQTVTTTKTILSQRVEGGLFRYVALQRILEAEAGYSFNEPPVVAVTEAIEEAVRGLIIEGVREGIWTLRNPGDAIHPAFAAYDATVEAAESTDAFGRTLLPEGPGLAIGVSGGATLYEGDYQNPLARPTAELLVRQPLTRRLGLGLTLGYGEIAADGAFQARHVAADVQGIYTLLPGRTTSPFVSFGSGLLVQPEALSDDVDENTFFPYLTAGLGVEIRATPSLGFLAGVSLDYPLLEGLDGVRLGRIHDNFYTFQTGLVFYTR